MTGVESLVRFVQRLSADAALWQRMLADPLGTARTEGIHVDTRDVKELLGIAGASDHELVAVIAAHLKRLDALTAHSLLDACMEYLFPDGLPPEQPRPRAPRQSGLPLGVRPEAGLATSQLAALRTLESFDLSPVSACLAENGTLPPAWLEDAIYEFRRYLGLRRVFCRSFAMFSDHVDQVWHTCLLFTELYADLCQRVFGRFAHHDPWDEPKPELVPALWERFAGAYRRVYGDPSYLWTIRLPPGTAPTTAALAPLSSARRAEGPS